MKKAAGQILILTTEELSSEIIRQIKGSFPRSVTVLELNRNFCEWIPDEWQKIDISELLDVNVLRHDFLEFLNDWPQKHINSKTFNEIFSDRDGYSLWWLGPGIERHPDGEIFTKLKFLWIAAKAIEEIAPQKILIFTKDNKLATILVSKCQNSDIECQFIQKSAKPFTGIWKQSFFWLISAIFEVAALPVVLAITKICAKLLAGTFKQDKKEMYKPAVVLTSTFPRHVRLTNDSFENWYWKEVENKFNESASELRCVYSFYSKPKPLGRFRSVSWVHHAGWTLLRKTSLNCVLEQSFISVLFFISRIPSQLKSLVRFHILRYSKGFRSSLKFKNADVSVLYIPALRKSIKRKAFWETRVDAICNLLREVGNVKAMLVCEEMYLPGMRFIAAAKKLSIPVIGVQHGNIFPMHLIYTVPQGQLDNAPVCDYFAAYGQFAKETLTMCGKYPCENIWITGAARLEHLVKNPSDKSKARQALKLDMKKQVILIATQMYPWFKSAIKVVFETLCDKNDIMICVKFHPNDTSIAEYKHMAQNIGLKNVLFFTEHFEQLLAACDILVSYSSTTMLEAALINKRTICLNFSDEPDRYPFAKDVSSISVHSREELEEALNVIFDLDCNLAEHRKFLKYHLGPTIEGHATEILFYKVKEIMSLA